MFNAIYGRQSREKKDSISIETQIEFGKREVPEGEEYRVYEDKGYSGGNVNRPDFQELMKDVRAGLIKKVIVYRLDRISRSILNFTSMMETFNKYSVEFVSCSEKLDTTTPAGRMVVNILIVFAQFERESAQQRITDNYYKRAKMGVFLGGNTPFGFSSTNIKIAGKKASMLVHDKNMDIVEQIYNMYAIEGLSLGKIAKYYNEKKILVGKKGACNTNTVSRIIRNPAYVKADMNVYNFLNMKGCIIHNNIEDFNGENGLISYGEGDTKFKDIAGYNISIGLHAGKIEPDIWLKAQYRIYNNKQIANVGKSRNTWLSGISKCGYCGYAMTYKSTKPKTYNQLKKEYKLLRCSGRTQKFCQEKMPSWKLEVAESTVFSLLSKHFGTGDINISNKSKKDNTKINNLKSELAAIDNKINNLVNGLMEADDVSMTYINKAIGELHNKKKEIADNIMKLKKNSTPDIVIDKSKYIDNWEDLDIEEKKSFASTYIEVIRFYKNDNLEIDFK